MCKNSLIVIISLILLMSFFIACGDDSKKENGFINAGYLPESFKRVDLHRSSEIINYVDESLWEYIDGGAEIYHLYSFQAVATADYKNNTNEMTIDIYKFNNSGNAYGLYSMLRPDYVETIGLGVEGFISPTSIIFVKGIYLVKLVGYDDSEESSIALINIAEELNELIPGTTDKPKEFGVFHNENKIKSSDEYYAKLFLGQKFLTHMYSQKYLIAGDTITLFVSDDKSGGKYLEWMRYAEKINKKTPAPENLPYNNNYSFLVETNFYGSIVAGLINGRLAGMANYTAKHKIYLNNWLNTLP